MVQGIKYKTFVGIRNHIMHEGHVINMQKFKVY